MTLGKCDNEWEPCRLYRLTHDFIKTPIAGFMLDFDTFESRVDKHSRYDIRKCIKMGYITRVMTIEERNERLEQVKTINRSKEIRQDHKVKDFLWNPYPISTSECRNHPVTYFGCFKDDILYAYISIYRLGDTGHLTNIFGHGEHLKYGIVRFLFKFVAEYYKSQGVKIIIYHRLNNGTQGLIHWKKSMGFKEMKLDEVFS